MGTDKATFEVVLWGGATGSDVTGSDISHVTGSDPVRKYNMRMRYRKSCHIRPSGAFWSEVTKSRDWKRPCPEVALTGSRFFACPAFSCAFLLVVVTGLPNVTQGHLIPSGFSLVYGTGSCATSVMTEGHVTPSEVSMGCFLRRPLPITLGKPASYI